MIDWFTVVAQIVNFLILVGLLKYFLYGRILEAMDRRQEALDCAQAEAARLRDEAERDLEAARDKNRQLDEAHEQQLADVRQQVEQYRQELTAKVRADIDGLRLRWSDAIREETDAFLRDLRGRVSGQTCSIARRTLADLADANLETQVVERFLDRIEQLPDQEAESVQSFIQDGNQTAVVQSAFPLEVHLQERIQESLRSRFSDNLELSFEQSDDLICGLAIQTNAHKLAWDIRDYLSALERELQQAIEEESSELAPLQPEPQES